MMHVLIVEDEAPARERLSEQLHAVSFVDQVTTAANGLLAIEQCESQRPDVVLLDIRMPEMDGMEAARIMQDLVAPPAIIFTTAYDQYAIEAFETEAVGYLLKPVRRSRLQTALEKAAKVSRRRLATISAASGSKKRFVSTRRQDELVVIPIDKVRYFEADQKYTRAWHSQGDDLIDESLSALESQLDGQFVRIHRKFLVNQRSIRALQRSTTGQTEVRLADCDAKLPVSRRHVAAVKRVISN